MFKALLFTHWIQTRKERSKTQPPIFQCCLYSKLFQVIYIKSYCHHQLFSPLPSCYHLSSLHLVVLFSSESKGAQQEQRPYQRVITIDDTLTGWWLKPTHLKKYARQLRSFPPGIGVKINIFETTTDLILPMFFVMTNPTLLRMVQLHVRPRSGLPF